jgi:hypothetical protein
MLFGPFLTITSFVFLKFIIVCPETTFEDELHVLR